MDRSRGVIENVMIVVKSDMPKDERIKRFSGEKETFQVRVSLSKSGKLKRT